MACPTCDEFDQQILIVQSRLKHAEDPTIRNSLEQQETVLLRQLNAHKALCESKRDSVR